MTATVKVPGYPDRLACEACGCQLVARRTDEPWRSALPDVYYGRGLSTGFNAWTHVLEVDEPPIHVNLDDGCPCHASYLTLLRNHYDDEAVTPQRKKVRR